MTALKPSRRKFLKILGGGTIVAASGAATFALTRTPPRGPRPMGRRHQLYRTAPPGPCPRPARAKSTQPATLADRAERRRHRHHPS